MTDLQGERITIEYIPLDDAVLWDENPKSHDIGSLCESIVRYGFVDPPKFDAKLGAFVYGNGRTIALQAMRNQGHEPPRGILYDDSGQWYIPVKFGIDQAGRDVARALAIDHNSLTLGGEFAVWDVAKMWDESYPDLLRLLAEAETLPVSVDGDDLDALLKEFDAGDGGDAPEAQVDRAAELQEKWGVKLGDVWEIPSKSVEGRCHRLMCGDSTSAENVAGLKMSSEIDFGIHDPPYGINIDTAWLSALNVKRGKPPNISDDCLKGDDGTLDISAAFRFKKWFVWGFPYIAHSDMTGWIVWDKWPGANDGLGNPVEMGCTNMWAGFRLLRVMWGGYYREAGESREPHPTQKPIGVIAPLIDKNTNHGDIICDLFLGSGTTMVAAEQLGRLCYGMEIHPPYCAVTLQRLADMGLAPHLVTDNAAA